MAELLAYLALPRDLKTGGVQNALRPLLADYDGNGILGEQLCVSCHHHQGVGRLGAGLVPVAWAEDGSVEAIELPGEQFLLGVQWHAEEHTVHGPDYRLFEALVAAAA